MFRREKKMSKRFLGNQGFESREQYLSPQDEATKEFKFFRFAMEGSRVPVIFWFPLRLICVTEDRSATSAGMVPLRLFPDQTPTWAVVGPMMVT